MIFAKFFNKPGLQQCLVVILYPVSRTQVCALLIDMHLRLLRLKRARSMHPLNLKNLAEKTGLAYIPLYSPSRKDREQVLPMTSTPCNSLQSHASFSDSEIGSGCEKKRYSRHLQRSFHNTELSVPLRSSTAVSKFLVHPPNPNQISTKHTKSSGCVLTSQENLALLAQKERNKLQEALQKEERRKEREERKQERVQQKLKSTFEMIL